MRVIPSAGSMIKAWHLKFCKFWYQGPALPVCSRSAEPIFWLSVLRFACCDFDRWHAGQCLGAYINAFGYSFNYAFLCKPAQRFLHRRSRAQFVELTDGKRDAPPHALQLTGHFL